MPRAWAQQQSNLQMTVMDAAGFPEASRSASKARAAVIEIVNGWLDGQTLTDEQLEKGWEHYLIENAEDNTQDIVVFLDIGSVHS